MNDKLTGTGAESDAAVPQGGLFVFGALGAREAVPPTLPSPLPGRPDGIFMQAPSPTLPPPLAAEPTVFHFGIQPDDTAPVSPPAASASASAAGNAACPPLFRFGIDTHTAAIPAAPSAAPDTRRRGLRAKHR